MLRPRHDIFLDDELEQLREVHRQLREERDRLLAENRLLRWELEVATRRLKAEAK